jgi:chlorobactene glucosyltransferase
VVLVLSVVWASMVFWLILRAFRQRNVLRGLHRADSKPKAAAFVTVIVPARDEAANIAACLEGLLAQNYPRERLHIIVVDDDSSDGTAAIVQAIAERAGNVRLVHSPPLPSGWKGKVNACCAGVATVPPDTEWLCFLDADMRARPTLIAGAVHAAQMNGLDLLSLAPRQELKSFAERLIIPCGLYLLSFSQDLGKLQSPDSDDVTATGQFMLLPRRSYEAAGGLATVRGSIVEDLDFARLIKRRGGRVLLLDGSKMLSTRMYDGWETLWPGIAKNLVNMLGGTRATIATAAAAVTLAWGAVLLPLLDIAACRQGAHEACIAAVPALAGSAAAFGLHIAGSFYFRIPFVYGFLFPLGYTAGAIIALDSVRWRLSGRVRWKGRVYR